MGGRLLPGLRDEGLEVRCLARNPGAVEGCPAVCADVLEPESLAPALVGVGDLPSALTQRLAGDHVAALHLIESLRFDSTVRGDAAARAFDVSPRGVREAIRAALASDS